MELECTEVFEFIYNNYIESYQKYDKIGFVLEGSSGSSKTHSIIQFLQIYSQTNTEKKITCGRAKMTWTIPSIWNDFKTLCSAYNLDYRYNESKYIARNNRNTFRFVGADDPQKFHGPRQDVFWFNEAMELNQKSFNQVNMRTNELYFLDYNPSHQNHWIYENQLQNMTKCKNGIGSYKIVEQENEDGEKLKTIIFYLHSTFRMNAFLPAGQRHVILSYEPTPENIKNGTADETHWKVYGLGLRMSPKGIVYPNWKICNDWPSELNELKPVGYWLDFGFSNDPCAIGRMWKYKGELYVDENCYELNLTNTINNDNPQQRSIEHVFMEMNLDHNDIVIADSAEKKSIVELRMCDYQVIGIKKEKITSGITRVKRFKLNIKSSAKNIIAERDAYKWKENNLTGELTNEPIDAYNHHMDGIRYLVKYLDERKMI